MTEDTIKEFDGYNRVVEEIEVSRKLGIDYSADRDSVRQYIDRLHPVRMGLRVADVIEVSITSKTLRLVSEDHHLPPFLSGQYIALFPEIGNIKTSRPYSLSSPPNQHGYYDITVRRIENGLVSNYLLDEVKKGDRLVTSGPAGNFYFNPLFHDRTMVCLAGGSGVTPFMSMIREIVETGLDRTVYLFHGNKTLDDAIFHDRIMNISSRFDNIQYVPVIENPPAGYIGQTGLITGQIIKEVLEDMSDKTFYLCGPQEMYEFCIPELEKLGIPGRKIRQEVYGTPVNICHYPGWPENVSDTDTFRVKVNGGQSLEAPASESLLVTLEKNGVILPSLCRSGECSMCRVKVISGKVFQPSGVPVRKSDRQYGYVHTCVSYPLADLEIVI
jgi:ferredoxin-NADP reductase